MCKNSLFLSDRQRISKRILIQRRDFLRLTNKVEPAQFLPTELTSMLDKAAGSRPSRFTESSLRATSMDDCKSIGSLISPDVSDEEVCKWEVLSTKEPIHYRSVFGILL